MKAKQVLENLSPYQQGKQLEEIKVAYGLDQVVKLSSNESPFGFSSNVQAYMKDTTHDLTIYPDGYATELRSVLAKALSRKETEFIFGGGSDEIIQIICRTYLYAGKNTVMATPTFPQYKHGALIEGVEMKEIKLTEAGYHDLDAMQAAIDANTAVVWLCTPNNPTGCTISRSDFLTFMDQCPKETLVVLDEAYVEFIEAGQDIDALAILSNYNNLIILRTFSKAYGLAGLRIGYGIANEAVANKLNIVRGPFNTSAIAQKAALIAFEDTDFLKEITTENRVVRKEFEAFLTRIDWNYYKSETNFLLVETPISGLDTFQYLVERGFIVRPGENLGLPNTVRITIGKQADMRTLQDVLLNLHRETKTSKV